MPSLPKIIEHQFEAQEDENEMICPYCGDSTYVKGEDYSVDQYKVEECGNCGKNFRYVTHIEVTHNTTPDCRLNSEEHAYAQRQSHHYIKAEECTICGHTKYGDPIVS